MFEYLLVVASTLIYFRVFHFPSDPAPPKTEKGVQTDPWFPTAIMDFMDVSSGSESEMVCTTELVDWFASGEESDSSMIELPPLVRQSSHGLKERSPMSQ